MAANFQSIDVSATLTYPVDGAPPHAPIPQVTLPFIPRSIAIMNESNAKDVYVSFDGVHDHAHLLPLMGMTFDKQETKHISLKVGSAGGVGVNVTVTAEE
jgi:hypothetical protein